MGTANKYFILVRTHVHSLSGVKHDFRRLIGEHLVLHLDLVDAQPDVSEPPSLYNCGAVRFFFDSTLR